MNRFDALQEKLISREETMRKIQGWKLKANKIVFTNGCFDILHQGHVAYLAKAASLGNRLVIGLNTDASVKNQGKGDERPINHEASRAFVLAAIGFVDAIVFFEEQTPLELIKMIQPDVLVKGADYDEHELDPTSKKYIVGADLVKANGGTVLTIPLEEGFSTTAIVQKLKK